MFLFCQIVNRLVDASVSKHHPLQQITPSLQTDNLPVDRWNLGMANSRAADVLMSNVNHRSITTVYVTTAFARLLFVGTLTIYVCVFYWVCFTTKLEEKWPCLAKVLLWVYYLFKSHNKCNIFDLKVMVLAFILNYY